MKKHILAVCDLETTYAHNFMNYMNRKRNIPFEIQAFTSVETLMQWAKEKHIEILLISSKAMRKEVKDLDIGKIMILSEGVHNPELDQYPSIYKYQSSDVVIREVMACYGAEAIPMPEVAVMKKQMDIVGIYSPLGRVGKTSFALTLGQVLAREKAVLYLNLEEYAGFEGLFQTKYTRNLSDALYYIRQGNPNLIHKLSGMIQTINNLDYIPPAMNPADLMSTSSTEWELLIQALERQSNYEVLVVDFGDGIDELLMFLDRCKRIYMPVLSDLMSVSKIHQFEQLLRLWGGESVLEKIQKIHPPYYGGMEDDSCYVEQLPYSQLGDYVRNLLRKERE